MPTPKSHLDLSRNHFPHFLQPLQNWASQSRSERDLEDIFGPSLNWATAFKHLAAFRSADYSSLPPVTFLPPFDMPGLWGAYSRDLRHIFLSTDCPSTLLSAVLIEEIGHFLDQELCLEETPGDEGALFATLVLGSTPTASDLELWSAGEFAGEVHLNGASLLVEAAAKIRGSGTAKTRVGSTAAQNTTLSQDGSVVYANNDSVRIIQTSANQRVIGSKGNDTFVVMSQDARIEDPKGGTDTVETKVNFSLKDFGFIENLTAAPGTADVTLGGNSKANIITGNEGNNKLDGGVDTAKDTLTGGAGNDTYVIRDTLDSVVETSSGGDDTIETTNANFSLSFTNVENVTYIGTGSATLAGNKSANKLTGGTLGDTLFGGSGTSPADTLIGRGGDDVYYVSRQSDVIVEGDGTETVFVDGADGVYSYKIEYDPGIDRIITSAATYSMAAFSNIEILEYKGASNSNLTGNSVSNSIYGGLSLRNSINAGAGDDYLIGGDTTDSLVGGEGNDTLLVTNWADIPIGNLGATLRAGGGSDTLNGGGGDDWFVVNSQTAYTFQDTLGTNTIASTVDFSLKYNPTIAKNIQNLYLTGTASLRGTGSDFNNTVTGNDGNNTLSAEGGNDKVLGGLGADIINGGTGNDTVIGGGNPQADIPANASTPTHLSVGQFYNGKIESPQDTDWIRVSMTVGTTYYFRVVPQPSLNAKNSDVAFGVNSVSDRLDLIGLVGDPGATDYLKRYGVYSHTFLVLNADGSIAPGINDSLNFKRPTNSDQPLNGYAFEDNNIRAFSFTAYDDGDFYIPVTGAGTTLGSYKVFVSDDSNFDVSDDSNFNSKLINLDEFGKFEIKDSDLFSSPYSDYQEAFADNASNSLTGGTGRDLLVAGGGRDSLGNELGDLLLGGTNGIAGSIDQDSLGGNNIDTLLGGRGNDILDGGKGADSMVGGMGSDTYFIDNSGDEMIESDNAGADDLAIISLTARRTFATDLGAGYFTFGTAASNAGLDSTTGAGFDVDLTNVYANIEHASLIGSANLYILGNGDRNSLTGNFGNNLLVAAVGDDTLLGEGGNDYLVGGDGGDLLDGGSGINTMDGGQGSDTYVINDHADRIINEITGLDGGIDLVRSRFNFDPILGDGLDQFDPMVPDNSPSLTKAKSFASSDLGSFYHLENFELLGTASYGVGNALGNSITAGQSAALLLGMGGEDTLLGNSGNDSLYGDTPVFYATPDIYAPAPKDTRTQEFLDGVIGEAASDYLEGGAGDDYLDGGQGFDTMVGGDGDDTLLQDNINDYIVAGGGVNTLISSVNISRAPDDISHMRLVVKEQERDPLTGLSITGQDQVASFASFLGSKTSSILGTGVTVGALAAYIQNGNLLEVMYGPGKAETFSSTLPPGALAINKDLPQVDPNDNTKISYEISWSSLDGIYDIENLLTRVADPVVGYTVRYKRTHDAAGIPVTEIWHTYVDAKSQDLVGTQDIPRLVVDNLDPGSYEFEVDTYRIGVPVKRDSLGNALSFQPVTLQGGSGQDVLSSTGLTTMLPGNLVSDYMVTPSVLNNPSSLFTPLSPVPLAFIFNPDPWTQSTAQPDGFATYLDGGEGNDILIGWQIGDGSGIDYTKSVKQWPANGSSSASIIFSGLHTMVGGLGSDTFIVRNGGTAIGDTFDYVIKYDKDTPVNYGAGGIGDSLNGGKHNLIISTVANLTLSDTIVSQGQFIDQLGLASSGQFGMGNRLDNYIYDGAGGNTLVGNTGRDSIVGNGSADVLIGGTAYGLDNVRLAIYDFADIADGGNGLTRSIFRDSDPIPEYLISGPGAADPSQFWFVPGYYGQVFEPSKNQDTLMAGDASILDGGAGHDSLVGSKTDNRKGDNFFVSSGVGGSSAHDISVGDAVFGNEGNDTVTFTDSDYLWWSGHEEGDTLLMNSYTIFDDISNLVLQMGAPTARNATGNSTSTGYDGEVGSNLIVGNEFDNIISGAGVGGVDQKGVGIDTLTGDGGQAVIRGHDNFIIGSFYRGSESNAWDAKIVTVAEIDPITSNLTGNHKHSWNQAESKYKDYDFAIITDFDVNDNLVLALGPGITDLREYSIGNIPSDLSNPGGSVGYWGTPLTSNSFGIYYTGATYGVTNPNLVSVIQTADNTLRGNLVARPSVSSPQTTASPIPPTAPFGWDDGNDFYQLVGSNFANFVNQTYNQQTSTAELSVLVKTIV